MRGRQLPPASFGRPILRPEGDRIVILDDKGRRQGDEGDHVLPGRRNSTARSASASPRTRTARATRCSSASRRTSSSSRTRTATGKADGPPKKFLTGFGGFDHDHGVHGINIGPDGKLYFTVGDPGVKDLQATDGKGPKFTQQQHRLPGRHRLAVRPRRHEPRTDRPQLPQQLRGVRRQLRRNLALATTTTTATSRRASATSCPAATTATTPAARARATGTRSSPASSTRRSAPASAARPASAFYEGTLLPKKYRGQLLHCDAGPREVRCFHLQAEGRRLRTRARNCS